MRRAGNPWELLVVLFVIGFIAQAIGNSALKVIVWLALGIYALVVLAPMFVGLGKALGWAAKTTERAFGKSTVRAYHSSPTWEAYLAISRGDLDELKRLMEGGVDPIAHFPKGMEPACRARTLTGYAREKGDQEALALFKALQRNHGARH